MNIQKVKEEASKFLNTPKKERRAKDGFNKLHPDVQHEVRKVLEGRRGFRKINGKIEFTDAELENQILRLNEKKQAYIERVPLIDERIADLEAEQASRQGETLSAPSVKSGRGRKSKRS
jgi:hypothetical protein